MLDLPEAISALEKNGYGGYSSIEMFNAELWQLPAKEAARRCYESPLCPCVTLRNDQRDLGGEPRPRCPYTRGCGA